MFSSLFKSLIMNTPFAMEMALRDLKGMNKGALLGVLWLFIAPIIQTAAYVIVVSFVFQADKSGNTYDYALYVLSGMIPWQILNRSLQEAPSLIRNRMDLVKQVVYPVETLPISSLIYGSFGSGLSLLLYIALSAATNSYTLSWLFLPLPILLLVMFIVGISWLFAIVGVLLKDLREMVTLFLSLLVYLSPVVVSREMVGETTWTLIMFNPLSHPIICFRDVYYGQFHPTSWYVFTAMAVSSFLVGGWLLNKVKLLINEYL